MNARHPNPRREESMALARRVLAHFRAQSTDQAPDVMRQPVSAYLDPARYAHEVAAIFGRLPLAIAPSAELPEPGDFVAFEILRTPLLIVRDEQGEVRVFLNACRHRGSRLNRTERGRMSRIVCPYHAWQYSLRGDLVGMYGEATFGDIDRAAHGLVALPTAERAGFIWTSLDRHAPFDIDGWLAGFEDPLGGLDLARWHLYDQREFVGPGWKVAWDGYLEAYHHNSLHTNTFGRYTIGNLSLHDTWGPHQRIVFGRRTLGTLLEQPESDWEPDVHIRQIHSIFPNVSISGVVGDHCLVSHVWPGPTPDTTMTRQYILVAKEPRTEAEHAASRAFSETSLQAVRDEDYWAGAGIQAALASGANEYFTYGRNEPAVQHFHRMVAKYAGPEGPS